MKKRYIMILAGITAAMMILGGCGAGMAQNNSSSREQELEAQINDLEQQINDLKNGQNTGNSQDSTQAADSGQSQGNTQGNSQAGAQNQAGGNSGSTSDVKISLEEAQNIALGRVQGATASNISIELDRDDGWYIYEGEIKYNGMEYEFEIDANSGNVLKWEEEKW